MIERYNGKMNNKDSEHISNIPFSLPPSLAFAYQLFCEIFRNATKCKYKVFLLIF